jgi:hypothetical protein
LANTSQEDHGVGLIGSFEVVVGLNPTPLRWGCDLVLTSSPWHPLLVSRSRLTRGREESVASVEGCRAAPTEGRAASLCGHHR